MPPYKQFPYRGFGGGLNLHSSPDAVPEDEALDALNVQFSERAAVQQRAGYAQLTTAEGTNRYDSLTAFYKSDGTKQLVAGAGNRLEAISTAGGVIANIATPTANPHFFQRFGGPTAEHLYIANGTDTVRRWTGAAFETPAYTGATPDGKFLGLSTTDNRLVVARFNGTVAGDNPSTVRFSNEGVPTTFTSTHYEDLTPGDGEEIMGVATWRDLIFVFKQSKFFVFYGNTVGDDGEPIFNYRPVDAGVGLAASRALAVTPHGVYFLDRTGIYLTTGSEPARVSDKVEPIFTGGSSTYYQGGELNDAAISAATMVYHDERLWLSFPSGGSTTNDRNLVFDRHEGWWTLYDIPAGPMAVFRPGNVEELIFGYASGLKHLGRHFANSSYTADNMDTSGAGGTAITARWLGGWFDLDHPAVKTIRESKIAGTGVVTVSIYRDFSTSPSFSREVQFTPDGALYDSGLLYDSGVLYGPSRIIKTKPLRRAVRGEVFAVGLSNDNLNKSFTVHRLVTHIREARVPSVVRVN
jgi:hypothetical protein